MTRLLLVKDVTLFPKDLFRRQTTLNTQGSAEPPRWVCVGFEGGFGPKDLGNSAQALAWVALFLRASPVRAPDNAGAIPIDRTQIQMTISSAPSGLVAFIVTPPRLKPGLSSQGPSGRNRLPIQQAPSVEAWRNPGLSSLTPSAYSCGF